MNFFKKIFSKTLTYKTYSIANSTVEYIKTYNFISDTFYSKEFIAVINNYLRIKIKKDWIGRLYGIINPNINIDGNIDFNNTIIELDGDNTNSSIYVQNWIYRQMGLIADLFKIQQLYDYINVGIEHVGPKNQDNYLIVFDIVSRQQLVSDFKKWLLHIVIYSALIGLCLLFLL